MDLLNQLGIDVRLLIAQMVNFLVLIFILYKFLYKPVISLLEERKTTIEKGLEDARLSEYARETAEKEKKEMLLEAKKKASSILEEAKKSAEAEREKILNYTKNESDVIIAKARDVIAHEKGKMIEDVQDDIREVVALAVEKVSRGSIDAKKNQKYITEVLEEVR